MKFNVGRRKKFLVFCFLLLELNFNKSYIQSIHLMAISHNSITLNTQHQQPTEFKNKKPKRNKCVASI